MLTSHMPITHAITVANHTCQKRHTRNTRVLTSHMPITHAVTVTNHSCQKHNTRSRRVLTSQLPQIPPFSQPCQTTWQPCSTPSMMGAEIVTIIPPTIHLPLRPTTLPMRAPLITQQPTPAKRAAAPPPPMPAGAATALIMVR